MNAHIDTLRYEFRQSKKCMKHSARNNLTKEEYRDLKDLKEQKDIVIKRADKGGAIVIFNTKDYLSEGYRQLEDGNFHQKLDHDQTIQMKKALTTIYLNLTQMAI